MSYDSTFYVFKCGMNRRDARLGYFFVEYSVVSEKLFVTAVRPVSNVFTSPKE